MSNFLSNLIARSSTDAPVIQPRVPSLFETAAAEFLDELQSPTPTLAVRETIEPTNVHASAPVSKSKSSPIRETVTIQSVADTSVARAEKSLPKADPPAHRHALLMGQARQPTVPTTEVKKLELETKKVILPVDPFRDGKKDAGEKKSAAEALSEPRLIQPFPRRNFSPVEQRPSTSAPVVRVTIGRIEVRAIHPPASAPKLAKPAPPKLSLEDYLQKRERGSR